jgi:hypothetical protein
VPVHVPVHVLLQVLLHPVHVPEQLPTQAVEHVDTHIPMHPDLQSEVELLLKGVDSSNVSFASIIEISLIGVSGLTLLYGTSVI